MPCPLATPLEQYDPFAAIFGSHRGAAPGHLRALEARRQGATDALECLMGLAEEQQRNVLSDDYTMIAALHHDDETYGVALWGLTEARTNASAMRRDFTAEELVEGAIRSLRKFYERKELGYTYETHYASKVQPPPESMQDLIRFVKDTMKAQRAPDDELGDI